MSRNTVAKRADMEDMSPAPPVPARRARPAVDAYAAWIGSVLEADLGAPRKQRRTAKRIYDRMVGRRARLRRVVLVGLEVRGEVEVGALARLAPRLLMCNKNCAECASRFEQREHQELSSIRMAAPLAQGARPVLYSLRAASFGETPPGGGKEDDRAP